jgi:hypothetical protein
VSPVAVVVVSPASDDVVVPSVVLLSLLRDVVELHAASETSATVRKRARRGFGMRRILLPVRQW